MKVIDGMKMKMKMDRKDISFSGREAHHKEEREYWSIIAVIKVKRFFITF